MLKIENLKAEIDGIKILKGINLTVNAGEIHAIMGPNGSGKSTLSSVIAGKEEYEVTDGSITFNNEDLLELAPEERANEGIFLSFQYPVEIPGISVSNFIKTSLNEQRKFKNLDPIATSELLRLMREKMKLLNINQGYLSRNMNEGFSGGEKKRNEIFQMAMLNPKLSILDETDSGLDIDALKIVANGVNTLKNNENATIVITHYQRLLDYIVPDYVHILHNGKIVKSGDKNLALEMEERGYEWITKEKNL
ncbi:MAG: Fe-S cluster assembly ATPase SufC [Flavobacteriales bacterium]|nr:Fe-S cluster assembly ATPase SufC [Flavobacteriales bacterium]